MKHRLGGLFGFTLVFFFASTGAWATGPRSAAESTFIVTEDTSSLCTAAIFLYGRCGKYRDLAVWNDIRTPYRIFIGQKLRLKEPAALSRKQGEQALLNAWRRKLGLETKSPPRARDFKTLLAEASKGATSPPAAVTADENKPQAVPAPAPRVATLEELFDEAQAFFKKRDYGKTLASLERCKERDPQFLAARILEVRTLVAMKRKEEAVPAAERLAHDHPELTVLPVIAELLPSKKAPEREVDTHVPTPAAAATAVPVQVPAAPIPEPTIRQLEPLPPQPASVEAPEVEAEAMEVSPIEVPQ